MKGFSSQSVNCPSCLKNFSTVAKYNRHEKTHSRPYKCKICSKCFALNADLRRHCLSHGSVEEKFKCKWPECGFKGTSRKDNLRKHMRLTHHRKAIETEADSLQALYDESILQQKQAMNDSPTFSALLSAARNGKSSTVQFLLKRGVPIDGATADGKSVLHAAAMSGNGELVRLLLDAGADQGARDAIGNSALHEAITHGHMAVVQVLARKRIVLSCLNSRGESALHLAATRGFESAVRTLVEHGANISVLDERGESPLLRAAEAGHNGVVQILTRAPPDDIIKVQIGLALVLAARRGHGNIVKILFPLSIATSEQEKTNSSWRTALREGSRKGHHRVVETLLDGEAGQDVIRKDSKIISLPLVLASCHGHVKVIGLLLDKGANINARHSAIFKDDKHKYDALGAALKGGHLNAVKLLLMKGALKRGRNKALGRACQSSNKELVEILFRAGIDFNEQDENGETVLVMAVRKGWIKMVELLVALGVDVDAHDSHALDRALRSGDEKVVDMLMDKGANLGVYDGIVDSSEQSAAKLRQKVKTLLMAGVDLEAHGVEALCRASKNNHVRLLDLLLFKGVDPNKTNGSGNAALHIASLEGHIEAVKSLLMAGAKPNEHNVDGRTALHLASAEGHYEIAEALIAKGAEVNVLGRFFGGVVPYMSALQLALRYRHAKVVKLLRNKGAGETMDLMSEETIRFWVRNTND